MGIKIEWETVDSNGFPMVSWKEDRNLVGGAGYRRIMCFIWLGANGVLQFASSRRKWFQTKAEMRPWESLVSFSIESSDQIYYSGTDHALRNFSGSSKELGRSIQVLLADGAYVISANFSDDHPSLPMYLTRANCTQAQARELHDRLLREFIAKREGYVREINQGEYVWKGKYPTFGVRNNAGSKRDPIIPWYGWVLAIILVYFFLVEFGILR